MEWSCYLIYCLDNNATYIGSTNNFKNRLKKHNTGKGAKRTKGHLWAPAILISGFPSKDACLSFESCWKRMCHYRKQKKLDLINFIKKSNYRYGKNPLENRFLDLMIYLWTTFFFHFLIITMKIDCDLFFPAIVIVRT